MLRINGVDPFVAVNENTKITGGYQAFGTRQNSYGYSFLHDPGMKLMCAHQFLFELQPWRDWLAILHGELRSTGAATR